LILLIVADAFSATTAVDTYTAIDIDTAASAAATSGCAIDDVAVAAAAAAASTASIATSSECSSVAVSAEKAIDDGDGDIGALISVRLLATLWCIVAVAPHATARGFRLPRLTNLRDLSVCLRSISGRRGLRTWASLRIRCPDLCF